MHSAYFIVLLAGAVAAQSTITIMYPQLIDPTTVTQLGSDARAATYHIPCDSLRASTGGSNPSPSIKTPSATSKTVKDLELTAIPSPTRLAGLRRQQTELEICAPVGIVQGPSTWEFHQTADVPGVLTNDANCNWEGELTKADVTCTIKSGGSLLATPLASTTVFKNGVITSRLAAFKAVAVVTESTTESPTGTPGSPAQTPGASPTPSPESTGLAVSGPRPTGVVAFAGGAVGILAAAMAL